MTHPRRLRSRIALGAALVIAALTTIGSARGGDIRFTDVSDDNVFRMYRGFHPERDSLPLNPFPGPGFADWDGDGDLDLPGYRNDCGTFVDVREQIGIEVWGHYRGGVWGDYDADGDFDLASLAYVWNQFPDRVWKNQSGAFLEVGEANGMNHYGFGGETATWVDYDGDRDLDLFVGNYECGALWRNDGADTFTDVLESTGIDMSNDTVPDPTGTICVENTAGPSCIDLPKPESSTFFDYNDDGWLDVFVASRLWKNTGGGTFQDVTLEVGGFYSYPLCLSHEEGFAPADVDNDGDFDISILYENQDRLVLFEHDASEACGALYCPRVEVPLPERQEGWVGTKWTDVDNDGDLDMLVSVYGAAFDPPRADSWYRNDGNWVFERVDTWRYDAGGNPLYYPNLFGSFGDYDLDGDVDFATWKYTADADGMPLMQYRVTQNDLNPTGGWLNVRVTDSNGHPTQTGATVRLQKVGTSNIQTRYVDGGTNWTVDSYDVHFAVEDAATYELSVTFPMVLGETLRVVRRTISPGSSLPGRTLRISRDDSACAFNLQCDGGSDPCQPLARADGGLEGSRTALARGPVPAPTPSARSETARTIQHASARSNRSSACRLR